jgi:hypothetical protein
MKIQKDIILLYLLYAISFLIVLWLILILIHNRKETMHDKVDMELVVSRYNEDLEWLKDEPFNQYPCIIYNKGKNDDYYHPSNAKETINVKNVGRESETYLYHIITHYDKLAEITVFLPGSSNLDHKLSNAKNQVTECEKHRNSVIIGTLHPNGVHKELYDFQLDDWKSTDNKNATINPESKLLPAEIRPFGKWHEARFPGVIVEHISYSGIFGIHRKHILQHPKSYYENLIRELETHSNPEVGHYFERSWISVFHPMEDAVII